MGLNGSKKSNLSLSFSCGIKFQKLQKVVVYWTHIQNRNRFISGRSPFSFKLKRAKLGNTIIIIPKWKCSNGKRSWNLMLLENLMLNGSTEGEPNWVLNNFDEDFYRFPQCYTRNWDQTRSHSNSSKMDECRKFCWLETAENFHLNCFLFNICIYFNWIREKRDCRERRKAKSWWCMNKRMWMTQAYIYLNHLVAVQLAWLTFMLCSVINK